MMGAPVRTLDRAPARLPAGPASGYVAPNHDAPLGFRAAFRRTPGTRERGCFRSRSRRDRG